MGRASWLAAVGAITALAAIGLEGAACTTFGGESEDGGVAEASTSTGDAATVDALADVVPAPPQCSNGAPPTLTFVPAAADVEPLTEQNGGAKVELTASGVGGLRILAKGTPPDNKTNGLRAFATWRRKDLSLSRGIGTLDYDLDIRYGGAAVFIQAGCVLELNGVAGETSLQLRFESAKTSVEGRQSGGGKSNAAYESPALPLSTAPVNSRREHVHLDLELAPDNLVAKVSYAGASLTVPLAAPTPVQTITLKCGINYSDNSDQKLLQVEIENVALRFCP